jgi:4-oxalocrotonate tautomerase
VAQAAAFVFHGGSTGDCTVPIVRVEIAEGVATAEQKRAVIRRMTDVLVEELGRNPEYIFVVIDEVSTDNWGRKGLSLTELWAQANPPPKS